MFHYFTHIRSKKLKEALRSSALDFMYLCEIVSQVWVARWRIAVRRLTWLLLRHSDALVSDGVSTVEEESVCNRFIKTH